VRRRLPPDAFAFYLNLGVGRSYEAVSKQFGVSVVCNDIPAHMTRSLRKVQPPLRGAEDGSERARTPLSSETGGAAPSEAAS